jgi:hypothetical protein
MYDPDDVEAMRQKFEAMDKAWKLQLCRGVVLTGWNVNKYAKDVIDKHIDARATPSWDKRFDVGGRKSGDLDVTPRDIGRVPYPVRL